MTEVPTVTICALLYGDHLPLADRCLSSITPHLQGTACRELRIGLNTVSAATRDFVQTLQDANFTRITVMESSPQIGKYPMMRRLFYEQPLTTSHVMWFDDDSFIEPNNSNFIQRTLDAIGDKVLLGRRYSINLRPGQAEAISQQPWFARDAQGVPTRPLTPKQQVLFPTGGWWLARTDFLTRFNWPLPSLVHLGGDYLLGELLRQQSLHWVNYSTGVTINANMAGVAAKSPRRGWSLTGKPWGT